MAQDRCPRCDASVEESVARCPSCDLILHYEGEVRSKKSAWRKGRSFFGLPRFMQAEKPDWQPPEVPLLPRGRWPARLAILASALLLAAYHEPILRALGGLLGWREAGEFPVKAASPHAPWARGRALFSPASESPFPPPGQPLFPPARTPAIIAISGEGSRWILSGKVYDLVTLEPLGRVALEFKDVTADRRFETASKPDGGFTADLPQALLDGYYVRARHRGYIDRPLFFEEDRGSKRVRSWDKARREKMGRDFARTILPAKPIAPPGGRLRADFFLIPNDLGK